MISSLAWCLAAFGSPAAWVRFGGAFLGILLLTIVKNSLLLLNVSTSWQTMVTAIFIIAGTSITALQLIISRKKHAAVGE